MGRKFVRISRFVEKLINCSLTSTTMHLEIKNTFHNLGEKVANFSVFTSPQIILEEILADLGTTPEK